ncbi:hypothetical protein WKH57_01355 [Niallia taxi]
MTDWWVKLDEIMTQIKNMSESELAYFLNEIFGEENSEEKANFIKTIKGE